MMKFLSSILIATVLILGCARDKSYNAALNVPGSYTTTYIRAWCRNVNEESTIDIRVRSPLKNIEKLTAQVVEAPDLTQGNYPITSEEEEGVTTYSIEGATLSVQSEESEISHKFEGELTILGTQEKHAVLCRLL